MTAKQRVASIVRRGGGVVAGSVMRVRTDEPVVVLTYDDGPTAETPAVLEALADVGATATFFVLLTRVRRTPGLLADVRDAGHEIALHGADHRRLTTLEPATAALLSWPTTATPTRPTAWWTSRWQPSTAGRFCATSRPATPNAGSPWSRSARRPYRAHWCGRRGSSDEDGVHARDAHRCCRRPIARR